MSTTRLYGDGRHRHSRITFQGRPLQLHFTGPDYVVEIEGIGTDIPQDLADFLFMHKGSGIRYGGGEPADAKQQEEEQRLRQIEEEDKRTRGDAKGGSPASPEMWPNESFSEEQLEKLLIKYRVKKNDFKDLSYMDKLSMAKDILAEKFPVWAEQEGYKKGD